MEEKKNIYTVVYRAGYPTVDRGEFKFDDYDEAQNFVRVMVEHADDSCAETVIKKGRAI